MSGLQVVRPSPSERFRWWLRNIPRRVIRRMVDAALAFVVWANRDSSYIQHVHSEVPQWFAGDGPNRWIAEGAEQLLAVLSHQGHSGMSIGFALGFFNAMARFKPWGPLTGVDDEWVEVGPGVFQNRRCSHVFKDESGAYDSRGRVFHDGDGICYTSRESRVPITFPYAVPEQPQVVDRSTKDAEA
jgi:hypothetical protein